MTDEDDFDRTKTTKVGYRRPPEKSRFKLGQSGNPHGRPKGALNMATILEQTLREPVIIVENGRRKTVTKLEAAIKQVSTRQLRGNSKRCSCWPRWCAPLKNAESKVPRQIPAVEERRSTLSV